MVFESLSQLAHKKFDTISPVFHIEIYMLHLPLSYEHRFDISVKSCTAWPNRPTDQWINPMRFSFPLK